ASSAGWKAARTLTPRTTRRTHVLHRICPATDPPPHQPPGAGLPPRLAGGGPGRREVRSEDSVPALFPAPEVAGGARPDGHAGPVGRRDLEDPRPGRAVRRR